MAPTKVLLLLLLHSLLLLSVGFQQPSSIPRKAHELKLPVKHCLGWQLLSICCHKFRCNNSGAISRFDSFKTFFMVKVKFHPVTCHEGTVGELRYSPTLSLTLAVCLLVTAVNSQLRFITTRLKEGPCLQQKFCMKQWHLHVFPAPNTCLHPMRRARNPRFQFR